MYEVLNTFKWNPTQNFNEISSILKNPKNFQKTPNLRFQNMKCMNDKGLEAYQVKKNLKNLVKSLRTKIGMRLECFWERNREVSREWSIEMRTGSRRGLI